MTPQQCQKLFEAYNRRFFGGRLPRYCILVTDKYGRGSHGLCRKKQREIHLGTGLRGQRLKEVLLHEMAHAASNGCHGVQWLEEMLRLAEMGAPTRKDWKTYQDKQQTMGEREITAEAYDAGMETDGPWSRVRVYIGNQYGLTDPPGRSESKGAARVMERCKKEFWKGRRFGLTCPPPSKR